MPTNATLDVLRFENCLGVYLQADLPEEWARPTLPGQFDPRGATPETVSIGFFAYECARAVHGSQVVQSPRLFYSFMSVRPTNSSWQKGGSGLFYLDTYAGSVEFATLLASFGLPNRVAAFEHDRASLPDGSTADHWTISLNATMFDFSHAWDNVAGEPNKTPDSRWFESTSFRRVDSEPDWLIGGVAFGLKASVVKVTGPSRVADVLHGLQEVPVTGQSLHSFNEVWTLNATVFR